MSLVGTSFLTFVVKVNEEEARELPTAGCFSRVVTDPDLKLETKCDEPDEDSSPRLVRDAAGVEGRSRFLPSRHTLRCSGIITCFAIVEVMIDECGPDLTK